MLQPYDHALALVLAVLFPLRAATFGFRRLRRAPLERLPETRRAVYRDAIVMQWSLVACVVALWLARGRAWGALGLEPRLTAGLLGAAAGSLFIVLLVSRQRAQAMRDDAALAHLRERMGRLEVMLPHARDEMPRFALLAVTAGICEELLYRGYLLWYVAQRLDVIPAAAVTAVVFGVGHAYQGVAGVLKTGLLGAFLVTVYLVTGSLYLPMLLHGLMDLHSGHLMLRAYEREAEHGAADDAGSADLAAGGSS
jgi:membrane protease YdiL (CAAX protease family)